MNKDLLEHIKQLSSSNLKEVIAIRRHIHQHPELSFEEHKTSAFIQSKLTEFGCKLTVLKWKSFFRKLTGTSHLSGCDV